jgi:ABC-type lipoprotein release transport system permease subunit
MGSWMAEDIGAEVGYWVTLVTRGNGGFFEAMDMQITGIVNCPNPNVNRSLLMVPIDTIRDYLAMEGLATEIDIALPELADIEEEKEKIAALVSEWESPITIMGWDEMASDYLAMIEAEQNMSMMLLFLVFLIAAVGISNTMIMVINERIRELGMLRALGMKDGDIHVLFLLNYYLVGHGIDYGFLMREMDLAYRIQSIFRGAWNLRGILITFISGVVLSVVVAWFPTKRATSKDIPSCLRHQ